jgi:hypothetical protein
LTDSKKKVERATEKRFIDAMEGKTTSLNRERERERERGKWQKWNIGGYAREMWTDERGLKGALDPLIAI